MDRAHALGAASTIALGPIRLEGRALLAPMSGVSDLAMRRIARRFGAALVFSEMVAAETYLEGDAEASMRAEGEGVRAPRRPARRSRSSGFGRDRAPGRGRWRRDCRHQHGLSGPAGVGGSRRRGADARSRSRRAAHRGGGRGGVGSGDRQDAARLGRDVAERAGARPPGRAGRGADGDRPRADPRPVL